MVFRRAKEQNLALSTSEAIIQCFQHLEFDDAQSTVFNNTHFHDFFEASRNQSKTTEVTKPYCSCEPKISFAFFVLFCFFRDLVKFQKKPKKISGKKIRNLCEEVLFFGVAELLLILVTWEYFTYKLRKYFPHFLNCTFWFKT